MKIKRLWILAVVLLAVLAVILWNFCSRNVAFMALQDCLPPECNDEAGNGSSGSKSKAEALSLFRKQTRTELLTEIRRKWLRPPSSKPYNKTILKKVRDPGAVKRLHKTVLAIFKNKTNGFFVESGAFDGLFLSNTWHLEEDYNWTGLLVEPDQEPFRILLGRNRKSWSINACLAIRPADEMMKMLRVKGLGALSSLQEGGVLSKKDPRNEEFEAQCFPLTSILAALGQTTVVDYLSLDIEGTELLVLKTIPWDHVRIKVITLEANYKRNKQVKEYLVSKEYLYGGNVLGPMINDHVFIHKSFEQESGVKVEDIPGLLSPEYFSKRLRDSPKNVKNEAH